MTDHNYIKDGSKINYMVQWYKNADTCVDYMGIGLMSKAAIYLEYLNIDND